MLWITKSRKKNPRKMNYYVNCQQTRLW